MADIIHLLPDAIANQIAAGEVIQRPASVVKELMENSIDAGASVVQVIIKDAGRTLIQIIDDGKGMSETDARMAFERHATSKITSADDLFDLHTMGFRGEALASIAAVAHIELRTRRKGSDLGTRICMAGSVVESSEADNCPEGSVFSVKNLFFNVPARRKFLKSNETEFRNIITEFERIALVNPQIHFSLYHNDTEIINLPASSLRQRVINVYGKTLNQKLLTIDAQSSLVTISGYVGRPDAAKKRGALQYFFVNGRFMKHPYFHKAIVTAYEQLIAPGDLPSYFIYFTLDPKTIDVNIHPTKTEIKFENEQPIWQILQAAVREALAKSSSIPTIDFNKDDSIDISVYNPVSINRYEPPSVKVNTNYNPFTEEHSGYSKPEFDWSKLYQDFEEEKAQVRADTFCPEEQTGNEGDSFPAISLFEEVNNTSYQFRSKYIITSLKSGLAIVDQNRAHTRILYDQYLANIQQNKSASQQLLFPEMIEFNALEANMLSVISDDLQRVGFDLSHLGNHSYAINGVPAGMEKVNPVELLSDIINKAIEIGCNVSEEITHCIALSLAKAAAIRPGKILAADEMEHLIASLFSCQISNLTPDGKLIISLVTDQELDKRFQ